LQTLPLNLEAHKRQITSDIFKGTVSQDWRELLMVEVDKIHLFNVAAEGLLLILIAFSLRKVLKKSPAGRSYYH